MSNFRYAVQCPERGSRRVGCFVYSTDRPFVALSPVLPDLVALYRWMRENGWRSILNGVWTCERIPKRFRALLTLQSDNQFIRYFDELIDAQHLCSRIARQDHLTLELFNKKKARFKDFSIEDTQEHELYNVADWDDYFGIQWSGPSSRS